MMVELSERVLSTIVISLLGDWYNCQEKAKSEGAATDYWNDEIVRINEALRILGRMPYLNENS